MVYHTIAEASEMLRVSKVTIYNKLKTLKPQLKAHIKLKQGIKYIDTDGIEIIRTSLNSKAEDLNPLKNDEVAATSESKQDYIKHEDIIGLNELNKLNQEVKSLKNDYILSLNNQIEFLKKEIERKSEQLQKKDKLLENFQVLLRDEQQNKLLLEEHIKIEKSKNWFQRLFNR